MHKIIVKSVVLDFPTEILEIKDVTGSKHVVPFDKQITVTMVGHPARETKTMQAHELDPYISSGYIFELIEFEEQSEAQALLNWQLLYNWTVQKSPHSIVGETCTNILDPLATYLNEQTGRQGWSVGPAIKRGNERLDKPKWVKALIEQTDAATSKQRAHITREQFLSVLEQVKTDTGS